MNGTTKPYLRILGAVVFAVAVAVLFTVAILFFLLPKREGEAHELWLQFLWFCPVLVLSVLYPIWRSFRSLPHSSKMIVIGYILTVPCPLIGFIFGLYLLFCKNRVGHFFAIFVLRAS